MAGRELQTIPRLSSQTLEQSQYTSNRNKKVHSRCNSGGDDVPRKVQAVFRHIDSVIDRDDGSYGGSNTEDEDGRHGELALRRNVQLGDDKGRDGEEVDVGEEIDGGKCPCYVCTVGVALAAVDDACALGAEGETQDEKDEIEDGAAIQAPHDEHFGLASRRNEDASVEQEDGQLDQVGRRTVHDFGEEQAQAEFLVEEDDAGNVPHVRTHSRPGEENYGVDGVFGSKDPSSKTNPVVPAERVQNGPASIDTADDGREGKSKHDGTDGYGHGRTRDGIVEVGFSAQGRGDQRRDAEVWHLATGHLWSGSHGDGRMSTVYSDATHDTLDV
jgi:hypothetical protein